MRPSLALAGLFLILGRLCALQVPLAPPADAPVQTMQVTCWGWSGIAQDEGDEAATWLSDFLQRPVRLVRYMGKHRSPLGQKLRHDGTCHEAGPQ